MATASTTPRQIPIVCPGHTRPLAEVSFLCPPDEPNCTLLVSACHDKQPMIRDAVSGDWIGTWSGHKGAVWSTKLDPMGYLAATASGDFSVKVWDAITGKDLMTFAHKHIVKTVDFSLDSKYLASGGHEGILRVFELEKGQKAEEPGNVKEMKQAQDKVNITKCIWLDNDLLLAAASDGKIRCWNVGSESNVCTLEVEAEVRDMEVTHLTKDGESQIILTIAAGTSVSFFKLVISGEGKDKKLQGSLLHCHKMPIHFREEGGATLHPSSGKKFVAGGSDLWVRVFDFETGEELECHRGHHGPIRCLRYAPDGKTYATGSEDGTIRLWKTDPKEES